MFGAVGHERSGRSGEGWFVHETHFFAEEGVEWGGEGGGVDARWCGSAPDCGVVG